MAANLKKITTAVTFTYDKVTVTLRPGQVVDVPAGSALETAIGTGNMTAAGAQQIASPATSRPEIDTVHMGGGQY